MSGLRSWTGREVQRLQKFCRRNCCMFLAPRKSECQLTVESAERCRTRGNSHLPDSVQYLHLISVCLVLSTKYDDLRVPYQSGASASPSSSPSSNTDIVFLDISHGVSTFVLKSFNASCSKLLLFEGSSAILV